MLMTLEFILHRTCYLMGKKYVHVILSVVFLFILWKKLKNIEKKSNKFSLSSASEKNIFTYESCFLSKCRFVEYTDS